MTDIDYLEEPTRVPSHREEGGLTLGRVVRILREYATPIALAMLAAAVGYVVLAIIYILLQPVERNTRLGFRLDFPGAATGMYPNGLKFIGSDIIDSPVLRAAFDANQLDRYMSFPDFARSVVVLEANAAMEQLARTYEAKLSNPKLSPVERDRIEAEYNNKRESLQKNEWALILTTRDGLTRVPPVVASKTLNDILRLWAEFAAKTRQVLLHRVPLVSAAALARLEPDQDDPFGSLLALRTAAVELRNNITALSDLPGAEVVRSTTRNASLRELELELTQIERTRIEFMVADILHTPTINRARAAALIDSQLAYDRRKLEAVEERVVVMRTALEDYVRTSQQLPAATTSAGEDGPNPTPDTIVLSDNFIERVVDLAQNAADRTYRQRQVDDIRSAALLQVPLRSVVAYEEQLLRDIRASGAGGSVVPAAQVEADRARIAQRLGQIATDLIQIRDVLSRSLNASGQMYTITSPVVAVTERGVSMQRLALGGILAVILVTLLAVAAAFIHYRLQSEQSEANARAA
ncbi:MAG: hypothetical protein QOJ98_336 [Acidobacteriota bacterium]|jgi:hypothetical protein|nr:hypothetical protein [Acidobacteriota bacterium]